MAANRRSTRSPLIWQPARRERYGSEYDGSASEASIRLVPIIAIMMS
jgi:hypothetical protein